jgi:predicted nucleic acid-binding protein
MTIIIDSSYFFALKAKTDKNHLRSLEILKELKKKNKSQKISLYLVLSETITLAVSRYNANFHYVDRFYELFWGEERFFQLVQLIPLEYKEVFIILKKYCTPKRMLSFVDASILYLYQRLNADYILSFDSHFDHIAKRLF